VLFRSVPAGTFVSEVHSGNTSVTLTQPLNSNVSGGAMVFAIPSNGPGDTITFFDTTDIEIGQLAVGAGINPGTYVTGVSGTVVNLSTNRWGFATGTYTFSDTKITFDPDITLPSEGLRLVRRPNYKLIRQSSDYTFRDPNSSVTTGFGLIDALTCNSDGSQVIVGAPGAAANGQPQCGLIHIYDRGIEKFIADGVNDTFTVTTPLNDANLYSVRVNGILKTRGVDYSVGTNVNGRNYVVFDSESIPAEGTIVSIDTNWFTPVQTMDASIDATRLQAGYPYTIISLGDSDSQTNFVAVGALQNTVGQNFVARDAGTGNGRVLSGTGKTSYHRLGTTTAICPNSCSIYAGAVGYSTETYTNRALTIDLEIKGKDRKSVV